MKLSSLGPTFRPASRCAPFRQDEHFVIETSPYGGVVRNRKDRASVPDFLEFPCHNRQDWDKLKPRLAPDKDRVDWQGDWDRNVALDPRGTDRQIKDRTDQRQGLPGYRQARRAGKFIVYYGPVGFGHIHQAYVGTEELCMAIAH